MGTVVKNWIKWVAFIFLGFGACAGSWLYFQSDDGSAPVALAAQLPYEKGFSRELEMMAPVGYLRNGEPGALVKLGDGMRRSLRVMPVDRVENSFMAFNVMSMNLARFCRAEGGDPSVNTVFNKQKDGGWIVYVCQKKNSAETGIIMGQPGQEPEGGRTLITYMLSVVGEKPYEEVSKELYSEYEKIKPLKLSLKAVPLR